MSQIAMIASPGTIKADVEALTGDNLLPVGVDAALNINILGGIGINVIGNPATNTLTISDDDLVQGSVTTLNAIPSACITFPLGISPGSYIIEGRLTGYNVTDVAGGAYFFSAGVRTTGAAAILIGVGAGSEFEEVAMTLADYDVSVLGNNLIIEVTGIAGKTINWEAEFEYQFAGI